MIVKNYLYVGLYDLATLFIFRDRDFQVKRRRRRSVFSGLQAKRFCFLQGLHQFIAEIYNRNMGSQLWFPEFIWITFVIASVGHDFATKRAILSQKIEVS